jgi:putative transposase
VSPTRRREAVVKAMASFQISERRACRALGVPRSSQRYVGAEREREEELLLRIRALAREHPRYGYRRIRALLVREGWSVNLKRVHRLWRREGLKVPQAQRKRRRLGSGENGCTRRRAERRNHVWSYDFIHDQTGDGRGLKMLPVVDEYTRECLTIEVERSLTARDVVSTLEYLFEVRGEPEFIRSDNGPEFIAEVVKGWLAGRGARTLYIAPGSPWENAYSETFNSRLRDELLDREVFETLKEAKVIVEDHRLDYNHRRPHSSLGYLTPAEFAAGQTKPGIASLSPAEAVPIPDPVLS